MISFNLTYWAAQSDKRLQKYNTFCKSMTSKNDLTANAIYSLSTHELQTSLVIFMIYMLWTQYLYKIYTISMWYLCNIYAISTQYLRRHQRSRYIYETTRSQWWTSRNERRVTVPSSSTAWRASRSRRRTTRTTISDTTSVSALYHHRIMTDNVTNPPTRIYRTSHSGFNTSISDRILNWKPMWCKSVNLIFNFCTRIQNRNRGDVISAANDPSVFTITEKTAFSWLKSPSM